jgi:predicted transcriptional regulator
VASWNSLTGVPVLLTRNETEIDSDRLVTALGNPRASRLLVEATEPMTVPELSDTCDVPLSTAYRKVKQLERAGLLSESSGFASQGHHATRYERTFDSVEIDLGDDGIFVRISDGP